MVEATPATSLEVTKPHFLFELQVIALDAPAQLCTVDELIES